MDADNNVKDFYDNYGEREWNRLAADTYRQINYRLHMDFIKDELTAGAKILDAGCGAGRFSIDFAQKGCDVTLLDISSGQLHIAKEKFMEYNLTAAGFIEGNIKDLSMLPDNYFDLTVCYGAPLSYVLSDRDAVMRGFRRVTRKGGMIAVSVNSKWGIFKELLSKSYQDFFSEPEYWHIDKVIETGDLPAHEKVAQPPRHFFEASELQKLFSDIGAHDIQLGAAPCLCSALREQTNALCQDERAFQQILALELLTYTKTSMTDSGEFLLAKGRV